MTHQPLRGSLRPIQDGKADILEIRLMQLEARLLELRAMQLLDGSASLTRNISALESSCAEIRTEIRNGRLH